MNDIERAYIGNPNITAQGRRAGVENRTDRFSGPAVGLLSGLMGTAPDEQGGSVLDPNSARNSPVAANIGFGVGTALQVSPLVSSLISLMKSVKAPLSLASKTVKIRDPQPLPQRTFLDDYKSASSGYQDGQRLAFDIEGRPLSPASIIAGRRVGGGMDEGISGVDQNRIADALGVSRFQVPRSGPDLKGDVGRFANAGDRRIFLDQSLNSGQAQGVFSHELGHVIDDAAGKYNPISKFGEIPSTGVQRDLSHNYDLLNNIRPGDPLKPNLPKKQASPRTDMYPEKEWGAENWAEAIRAYMRDPNYFKTVAPKAAARVREYVNSHSELKDIVQFNSGAGLLGYGVSREDASSRD